MMSEKIINQILKVLNVII